MATSSTTNYHFPYPLGSDSLSNIALRVQELAEYIDATYTTLDINLTGSTALMQVGDAAGGALMGTYPNPTLNPSVALPNGMMATTQPQSDNSTKVATTAYVDAYIAGTVPAGSIDTTELADGAVTNVKVNAAAAISYSKLDLTNSIVNNDIATSAAISYSKLNLTNSIVNGDIVSLAWSKITSTPTTLSGYGITDAVSSTVAQTANTVFSGPSTGIATAPTFRTLVSNDIPTLSYSKLTLTNSIVNADIATGAAITYAKLSLTGSIVNADIAVGAAIAYSKLDLTGSIANTDIRNSVGLSVIGRSASTTGSVADITAATDGHVLRRSGTAIGFGTIVNAATTATNLNTASAIVARDASGNFSAGTITANLTGTASNVTTNANMSGDVTSTGNTTSLTTGTTTRTANTIFSGPSTGVAASPTFRSLVEADIPTLTVANKVSNSATTATNANTASTIVSRDASGNFSAGTITATLSGNASTVTTNANMSGDVTSTGNTTSLTSGTTTRTANTIFAGPSTGLAASPTFRTLVAADIPIISYSGLTLTGSIVNADISNSAAIAYSKLNLTGAILNADLAGSITDSKLNQITTAGKVANSATTATNLNTASAIVARDASGNFSAGTITAGLTGTASLATALAGGSANAIPYQTGAGATSFITGGSVTNVLTLGVGGVPGWAAAGTPGAHASTHASGGTDPVTLSKTQITGTAITQADTGTVTSGILNYSLASAPASPVEGQTYWNSASKKLFVYNATALAWVQIYPAVWT